MNVYQSKRQLFQSTLPARGATSFFAQISQSRSNFNPRSPHGERLSTDSAKSAKIDFNPRSPHGERQTIFAIRQSARKLFQSTLPARGATVVPNAEARAAI